MKPEQIRKELKKLGRQLVRAYDLPTYKEFSRENDRIYKERMRILSFCNHQIDKEPKDKEGLVDCIHCQETFWYCPDSPNHFCKYDEKRDPAHDHCLYCDKPLERK